MQAKSRKQEDLVIPGVGAMVPQLDIVIQIMYPDRDHMWIPGVWGLGTSLPTMLD